MFGRIARRYDFANFVLSFGIYKYWYRRLIVKAKISAGMKIVDVAAGTGNLSFAIEESAYCSLEISGVDFSEEMLDIAKSRAKKKKSKINFINADALNLPFPDDYFERAVISFGIRNVATIEGCLKEMSRVVKNGGRILILEFGQPVKWFKPFFSLYSKIFIKFLGRLITGDKDAYQYLVTTSAAFPSSDNFINIMKRNSNLQNCGYDTLTFGITYLYYGDVVKR